MLPHKQIELRLQASVREILPDADVSIILVRPCPDPKFGDYQSNALMSLAKTRKLNPRQLATDVVAKLDVSDVCEKVEIAGAGFLNFRLKNSILAQTLEAAARGEHLFFEKAKSKTEANEENKESSLPSLSSVRKIVLDFSSPNVAKPMHVGHIRSTGIGDALQRTLRLLGHHVVSDNHIGDWGTQFGMLIIGWKNFRKDYNWRIEELVRIYKLTSFACELPKEKANEIFEALKQVHDKTETNHKLKEIVSEHLTKELSDSIKSIKNNESIVEAVKLAANSPLAAETLADAARLELVKLQSGDSENRHIWEEMIKVSKTHFNWIYKKLGVEFTETLGESFYNPWLGEVVDDLLAKKIARESEGAVGVFSDGSLPPKEDPFLVNRDGEWIADPALVRKSDGGFNYTTTDLATIDYRLKTWSPDEIIYVVDDRQSAHFKKLFAIFARWKSDDSKKVKLVHVGFGKILGDDGKPFKTRSGDTVKLGDLLDEAEVRAFKIVSEKSLDLSEAQRKEIARVVGIGAVKYADLLPNRQSDYIFSWDKMLALQGNTAPYLLYAYARIKSIFRKNEAGSSLATRHSSLALAAPEEIALAKHLLNFGLTLEAVAEEYRPNFLCNYLFELAGKFTSFYENCPVLKAEDAVTRDSRLALCDLAARVLKQGLDVLGIEVVEQM